MNAIQSLLKVAQLDPAPERLAEAQAMLGICILQLRMAANALEAMDRPNTAQACRNVADEAEPIRWRKL